MNQMQKIQERRLRIGSFNDFDGPTVADSLSENQGLWRGYVFVRLENLYELRDIADGYLNCDTLYILPASGQENALELLAHKWHADEIDWIGGKEASNLLGSWSPDAEKATKVILRVWWD